MKGRFNPVRLGIVGAGFTGYQAAKNCHPLLACMEALAIADCDDMRRKAVADKFSVPRAYSDYRDILDDDDIDAVYYGVPPDIRFSMVLEGLEAGKHALVQKPHATRAPQIRDCFLC